MLARRLVAGLARIRARSAARSSSSWTDRVLAHPAAAARLARAEERLRALDEELAAGGGAAAAAREHAALSELQGAARANDSGAWRGALRQPDAAQLPTLSRDLQLPTLSRDLQLPTLSRDLQLPTLSRDLTAPSS